MFGDSGGRTVRLTLGAYTVAHEAYEKEIIPAFKRYWQEKTGSSVSFETSYAASGAQARAIQAGFEADIAALSLEKHIDVLEKAGLVTHDWRAGPHRGVVTRSVVVIAHRPGNPKNIRSFSDLSRQDIDVIYPDPKTSGGAMWVVCAIYGAGLKQSAHENTKPDPGYARQFLKSIQKRVAVMDESGRMSVQTFESGRGDALVTYENEALLRQKQGDEFPFFVPSSTIEIENPVALVDKNVDKHGNREAAEAFVRFLYAKSAQRAFARCGFRPVDPEVAEAFAEKYPRPAELFDIGFLGGWKRAQKTLFGPEGVWTEVMKQLASDA
jgi:sulfate transport system substrate-binding protein